MAADEVAGAEQSNSDIGNVDGNGNDGDACTTVVHAPTGRNDRKNYASERSRRAQRGVAQRQPSCVTYSLTV